MIHHLFFFIQILIAIYLNRKLSKENFIAISKNPYPIIFWICFMVPLVEPSLFRHTVKYYLQDIEWGNYINVSCIFVISMLNDIKLSIYDSLFNVYLGWYLLWIDNIFYSLIIHLLHNIVLCSTIYFLTREKTD